MANSKRKSHCNKKPFKSLLAAQIAARKTTKSSIKKDPIVTGLGAYKCHYCNHFHVGRSSIKGIDWALVSRVSVPRIGEFSGG